MSSLSKRTLVINRNYQPVTTITLQRAVILLCKEVATVVAPPSQNSDQWQEFTWKAWEQLEAGPNQGVIKSARKCILVPEIVKLLTFGAVPQRKIKLSRRAIYARDSHTCQYCGEQPDYEEFTIDHIHPKSQGGRTTWENVVLACGHCNRRKADRTPKEAGMKLLSKPGVPTFDLVLQGRAIQYESWYYFLGN